MARRNLRPSADARKLNAAAKANYKGLNRETISRLAETRRQLAQAERAAQKDFRASVAELKKFGLLERTSARSAKPTRYLKNALKEFASVISGKAKTVKAGAAERATYRELGYKVQGSRVVIPVQSPASRVRMVNGKIRETIPMDGGEIDETTYPVAFRDLQSYLDGIEAAENSKPLKSGEAWAFKFYGNNSLATFSTFAAMMEYLNRYVSIQRAIIRGDAEQQADIIRNLSFIRTKRDYAWRPSPKTKRPRKYDPAKSKRYRERAKLYPVKKSAEQVTREREVAKMKAKKHRDSLTPAAKAAYKEAARIRAARSRKGN